MNQADFVAQFSCYLETFFFNYDRYGSADPELNVSLVISCCCGPAFLRLHVASGR